jgi:GGDEF domain-containing protein
MPALTPRPPSTGPRGSSVLLRSYQKALFWRRLILAGFFTVFTATLLYLIPWLPGGMSEEDYDSGLFFLLLLMLIASLLAFGAVYLRDLSNRVEQTMLTWTTVNDGLSDLRRREYFFDRIALECSRAAATGHSFTVVTLRLTIPEEGDAEKINRGISALEPVVREYDCLSSLGPHELGVLGHGVRKSEALALASNLAQIVQSAFPEHEGQCEVNTGYAVYGEDATDAGSLIGMARERLMRARRAGVRTPLTGNGQSAA